MPNLILTPPKQDPRFPEDAAAVLLSHSKHTQTHRHPSEVVGRMAGWSLDSTARPELPQLQPRGRIPLQKAQTLSRHRPSIVVTSCSNGSGTGG